MNCARKIFGIFIIFALAGCGDKGAPKAPDPQRVYIGEREYLFTDGRYETMRNRVTGIDMTHFRAELTNYGGIIVEVADELLGQRVEITTGDVYWWFSIGDGTGPYRSAYNYYSEFPDFTGWFEVGLDAQTGMCSIEFELTRDAETPAHGSIAAVFRRVIPNIDPEIE